MSKTLEVEGASVAPASAEILGDAVLIDWGGVGRYSAAERNMLGDMTRIWEVT